MIAVSGFSGAIRWGNIGDATIFQSRLAALGFACLLLVAAFELDVVPERFLEDKLLITSWLLKKSGRSKLLPFKLHYKSKELLEFIRESSEIYPLYSEDTYIRHRNHMNSKRSFQYSTLWSSIHILGALGYVLLVTTAIVLNDIGEAKVGYITISAFLMFGILGYLTGQYIPMIPICRCWIMTWNPWVEDPQFMMKLNRSIDQYTARRNAIGRTASVDNSKNTSIVSNSINAVNCGVTSSNSNSSSVARRSKSGKNSISNVSLKMLPAEQSRGI